MSDIKSLIIWSLALVFCGSGSAICLFETVSSSSSAKSKDFLIADEGIKHIGPLPQQSTGEVAFHLINRGRELIEILQVPTTCSCTTTHLADWRLKPGQSTKLTVTVNTGVQRGEVLAQSDVLYRIGESQSLSRLSLRISITVNPHYTVRPEEIVFEGANRLSRGAQHQAVVEITPNMPPEVHVQEVFSSHPAINVVGVARSVKDGVTRIKLCFDPSLCQTPWARGDLLIRTDSKVEPEHRVVLRIESVDSGTD